MKVNVAISVTRDDGVTLQQSVTTETQRLWVGANAAFQRETKAQVRKRLDRLVTSAINSTLGR